MGMVSGSWFRPLADTPLLDAFIHYSFPLPGRLGRRVPESHSGGKQCEILDADGAEKSSRTGKEYQSVLNGEAPQVWGLSQARAA